MKTSKLVMVLAFGTVLVGGAVGAIEYKKTESFAIVLPRGSDPMLAVQAAQSVGSHLSGLSVENTYYFSVTLHIWQTAQSVTDKIHSDSKFDHLEVLHVNPHGTQTF